MYVVMTVGWEVLPCHACLSEVDGETRRRAHIPPNLVVTTRASHKTLDLSIRYHHHISSAPMASDRGMRHGTRRQTDTSQPHHHCRFPRRNPLLPPPW